MEYAVENAVKNMSEGDYKILFPPNIEEGLPRYYYIHPTKDTEIMILNKSYGKKSTPRTTTGTAIDTSTATTTIKNIDGTTSSYSVYSRSKFFLNKNIDK